MARMRIARRPEECSGSRQDAEELFSLLTPAGGERLFRGSQLGWGLLAAQNSQVALGLVKLTRQIAGGPFLSSRPDLREVAVQAVNMHYQCEFSYRSHLNYLSKVGLSIELMGALPYWRTSDLFDAEQKLVIEYSLAVVSGNVPSELHSKVASAFGEDGAAELALAIAHWSFWAMFLNAAQPEIEPAPARQ